MVKTRLARLRGGLTYANVMSTIAVFALLGGGAYAAKQKIDTKDIKNKAVTNGKIAKQTIKSNRIRNDKGVKGIDVKDGSLSGADIVDGGLTGVDVADHSLSGAKLAPSEQFHVVGTAGEPAFGNGGEGDCTWSDATSSIAGLSPVAFRKTSLGYVELSGIPVAEEHAGVGDEECGSTSPEPDDSLEDGAVFTLPPAYRPQKAVLLGSASGAVLIAGTSPITIPSSGTVPAGTVIASGASPGAGIPLQNISFPAASAQAYARHPAAASPRAATGAEVKELLGL